ncbi:hypothetical protein C8Q78DRAFT_1076714 [Trametes maxima]|nr:hypothetical protein C8Q78DRAFT_1076714 [Trametes maxima]
MDRKGRHRFFEPTPLRGYLPQINEWSQKAGDLQWQITWISGLPHVPIFHAVPIYEGERLFAFAASGPSKKAAKEKAAEFMARSGHCVMRFTRILAILPKPPALMNNSAYLCRQCPTLVAWWLALTHG